MLPTDGDKFAESRFMKLRHEELGWMWKALGKGEPKLKEMAGKLCELTTRLAEDWTLAGADKTRLEYEMRLPKLGDRGWIGSMEVGQARSEDGEVGPTVGPQGSESDSSEFQSPLPPTTQVQSRRDDLKRRLEEQGRGQRGWGQGG